MKCPFLRQATVRYCRDSAWRKMIATGSEASERCSSSSYRDCPAAASLSADAAPARRCPLLVEAPVEYCEAAATPKYIPATDALLARCNSRNHRFCEVFLGRADPEGRRLPAEGREGAPRREAELLLPPVLSYAPNHLWLDVGEEDGRCHIGVDAFLARLLGPVDSVGFVIPHSTDRPVAILSVRNVDVHLQFPNPLHSTTANFYLRANPQRLTRDPYGAGWLFEGFEPTQAGRNVGDSVRTGLIPGDQARARFRPEIARLDAFVRYHLTRPQANGMHLMNDGGVIEGVASALEGKELLSLLRQFLPEESIFVRG